MDDCLKSVSSKREALHLYHQLTDLLMKGGFHLTQLISNSSEVLNEIPVKKRSSSVLNLIKDVNLRVLGVKVDFISDNF